MAAYRRVLFRIGFVIGVAVVAAACHENGTVFAVDTTTDTIDANAGDGLCADASGDCSLRAAIMEANARPGTEKIALVDGLTYSLSIAGRNEDASASGDLDILEQVVIDGDATVDAGAYDRVFDIRHSTGLVELIDVTITGGDEDSGSAVRVAEAGATLLQRATVTGNSGSLALEGVVHVDAGVALLDSVTIHDNDGATIGAFPVVIDGGSGHLINTTIATGADHFGAAILVADGSLAARATTIVIGPGGDPAVGVDVRSGAAAVVGSSIVLVPPTAQACSGPVTSAGGNVVSDATCGFAAAGDVENTDPLLGPLADNGGPVVTFLPGGASPAVDRVANCASAVDARGVARPQGTGCDSGAVERAAMAPCSGRVPSSDLSGCDLSGLDLSGLDLTGSDLSGADLTGADLTGTVITDVDLTNAVLTAVTWVDVVSGGLVGQPSATSAGVKVQFGFVFGPGVDLSGETLGVYGDNLDLTDVDLSGADLSDVTFETLDLTDVSLIGADLTDARFLSATLLRVDATDAVAVGARFVSVENCPDFSGSDLLEVDLTRADLSGAYFCNSEFDDVELQDAVLGTATFDDATRTSRLSGDPVSLPTGFEIIAGHFFGPGAVIDGSGNLSAADLSGRTLVGTINDSDLTYTDFSGSDLRGLAITDSVATIADFGDARMTGMWFTGNGVAAANFDGADLTGIRTRDLVYSPVLPSPWVLHEGWLLGPWAEPQGVGSGWAGDDLSGVDLTGARIVGAQLTGTDLTDASLAGAEFISVTWSGTTCPDGSNSDTNGSGSCIGHEVPENYVIDAGGVGLDGAVFAWADVVDDPSLTYLGGDQIVNGVGTDWFLDGVLFRDGDLAPPYTFSNNTPQLPFGVPFNGEQSGSGTTFVLTPGDHVIESIGSTAGGTTVSRATFRVLPSPS
ncbi:MAG: pentapeptide repeat-containing protein [Actinomycetota bacterium]